MAHVTRLNAHASNHRLNQFMPWALYHGCLIYYIYHNQRGHFPLINHTREDISMKKEVKNNGPINSHDFKILYIYIYI